MWIVYVQFEIESIEWSNVSEILQPQQLQKEHNNNNVL